MRTGVYAQRQPYTLNCVGLEEGGVGGTVTKNLIEPFFIFPPSIEWHGYRRWRRCFIEGSDILAVMIQQSSSSEVVLFTIVRLTVTSRANRSLLFRIHSHGTHRNVGFRETQPYDRRRISDTYTRNTIIDVRPHHNIIKTSRRWSIGSQDA